MSIKRLIDNIGKANLAEGLDEAELVTIGSRVLRQYEEDLSSMDDWSNAVENGIDLMRQEYSGKSYPWEGASNYKDPILTEAATVFGDKASLELMRSPDLVSSAIIGRDPRGEKKLISDRVTEAMNYQVNYDMDGWRDDQERLFYCLPVVGTVFKKLVYDPVEKKCEAIVVNYPDFAVNQATKSMSRCRSFSHILEFTDNEVEERVRCGKWLDPNPEKESENNSTGDQGGDYGGNEQQEVVDNIDNPLKYIEQHTFYDLDGDGYEEPYIITIKHSGAKVVRILPRYDEQSIIVESDGRYLPVSEVLAAAKEAQLQEFGGPEALELIGLEEPELDPDQYTLIKIEAFQNIVKYGFITSPDNTFLDLGYSHLLGALTMNINTTTNQINDRTTLNILGGGWLAKEFKVKQGFMRFRMGEYKQTEVPAEKLAKGIFPQPLQEPSQTAYQMRADMQERSRNFLAVVDISGKLQASTAPTTALAIIQEAIIPTTALFKRILSAESREFQILFRINQRTFDPAKYKEILDDPEADPQIDFNMAGLAIIPTANAEMSSKMHRIQTAQLEMEQIPLILQMGGNPVPVVKNFFDAIGSELIDDIFPEEGSMSPADQKARDQMLQAQEQANKIAELQLTILTREQDRLDAKNAEEIKKMQAEVKKLGVDMLETLAKAAKYGEEAETESMKNAVTIYTAQLESVTNAIGALGAMNARELKVPQLQTGGGYPAAVPAMAGQPGNSGALLRAV